MINHTQQPLRTLPPPPRNTQFQGTRAISTGLSPGWVQTHKPCAVALPPCLLGGYSTRHHNAEEIYKRGRKKIQWVPGGGKHLELTWANCASDRGRGSQRSEGF